MIFNFPLKNWFSCLSQWKFIPMVTSVNSILAVSSLSGVNSSGSRTGIDCWGVVKKCRLVSVIQHIPRRIFPAYFFHGKYHADGNGWQGQIKIPTEISIIGNF